MMKIQTMTKVQATMQVLATLMVGCKMLKVWETVGALLRRDRRAHLSMPCYANNARNVKSVNVVELKPIQSTSHRHQA
jgi:hypothetical protein